MFYEADQITLREYKRFVQQSAFKGLVVTCGLGLPKEIQLNSTQPAYPFPYFVVCDAQCCSRGKCLFIE